MPEQRIVVWGQRVVIKTEPGKARLFLDDEEIQICHYRGGKPFSTRYLPYLHYDSLESLAMALVHHRFPGGSP